MLLPRLCAFATCLVGTPPPRALHCNRLGSAVMAELPTSPKELAASIGVQEALAAVPAQLPRLPDMHGLQLHLRSPRWPSFLQAVLAPVQAMHLRVLERSWAASRPASAVEAELRPILFPSERVEDAATWRRNLRLVAWMRKLHIEGLPETRALLPAAERALLGRPPEAGPPTMAEVRSLFGLTHPDGRLPVSALQRAIDRAADGADGDDGAATAGCTRGLPWTELLQRAGGMVRARGPFHAYAERHGIYELVTAEYVEALAEYAEITVYLWISARLTYGGGHFSLRYIVLRLPALRGDTDAVVRIAEVGAGHGELAHHLRASLERLAPGATRLEASDDGSWALPGRQFGEVRRLGIAEALAQSKPRLVIAAWMPMGADWSAAFRKCPSVAEYARRSRS